MRPSGAIAQLWGIQNKPCILWGSRQLHMKSDWWGMSCPHGCGVGCDSASHLLHGSCFTAMQTAGLAGKRHASLLVLKLLSQRSKRAGCTKEYKAGNWLLLNQEVLKKYFIKFSARKKGKHIALKILIPRCLLTFHLKNGPGTNKDWGQLQCTRDNCVA